MKKTLILFLTITMLAACSGSKDSKTLDTAGTKAIENKQTQALIKKFKPIMDGVWVKSSYIKSISQTKSPYQSSESLGGVAAMYITLPADGGDSTHVGYSLNNHEGSDFILYLKTGKKDNSLKISLSDYNVESNFYELGYSKQRNDTVLILYHYNKALKILDKTSYTRVARMAGDKDDAGWGIQFITNKTLTTGNYSVIDTVGKPFPVQFANDGKVSGFPDFKTYYVNTDFAAGPENNADEIIFDFDSKRSKAYIFRFKSDSLLLYDEKHNSDSTKLIPGVVKYKLVKEK